MAKRILVPLDGSTFAEHALPVALELARKAGARLHLVQVHEVRVIPLAPDTVLPFDAEWDERLRVQEHEYLTSVSNRIVERAGVVVRSELLDGTPAAAIATYAREMEIDLIVMTTHGRGGLSRMWLGSVADAVVRRCHLPVLLLRPHERAVDFDAVVRPQHILVPLDGSPLSVGMIEHATWLGSLFGARYTLYRATLPVPTIRPVAYPEAWADTDQLAAEHERAKQEVEAIADTLRGRDFDVETAVVEHSVPAVGILEFASTNAVDLIALATHGRGGWTRFALGSVADKVLRGAPMPVLLFRPPVPAASGGGENGGLREAAGV